MKLNPIPLKSNVNCYPLMLTVVGGILMNHSGAAMIFDILLFFGILLFLFKHLLFCFKMTKHYATPWSLVSFVKSNDLVIKQCFGT